MKAIDPEGTIILNVRAITAVMRNAGLEVRRIDAPKTEAKGWFGRWRATPEEGTETSEVEGEDRILSGDREVEGTGGRWSQIALVF